MIKFRRVTDFKTRFFAKISKHRTIFLPKQCFSQFRDFRFFDCRVYEPKSSNRLGLRISKCRFQQIRRKLNLFKIAPWWKIVFWRFQQIPKIEFSEKCRQHCRTNALTHRHHRKFAISGHFTRAHWQILRQNVCLRRKYSSHSTW